MIREVSQHSHRFSGHETWNSLTAAQLRELVLFDFDRVATEFDDEKGVMKIIKREVVKRADSMTHQRLLKRELKRMASSHSSFQASAKTGIIERKQSKLHRIQSRRLKPRDSQVNGGSGSFGSGGSGLDKHQELMEAIKANQQYKHVDFNDRQSMAECVLNKARSLVKRGVIALPTVGWDGQTVEEREALQRIEFIFSAYKVEFYFYELLEMVRKLLMVGCMGMIYNGLPQQFAIGLIITGIFLVYSLRVQPYAHHGLNALNFFSLSFQTIMLTAGLMEKIATITEVSATETDSLLTKIVLYTLYVMLVVVPACILIVENDIRVLNHVKRIWSCCSLGRGSWRRQAESTSQQAGTEYTPQVSQQARTSDPELAPERPPAKREGICGCEADQPSGVGVGYDVHPTEPVTVQVKTS